MVINVKEKFEKTRHVKKMMNLIYTLYVEKEIQDVMLKLYLIQKSLIISRFIGIQKGI